MGIAIFSGIPPTSFGGCFFLVSNEANLRLVPAAADRERPRGAAHRSSLGDVAGGGVLGPWRTVGQWQLMGNV